MSRFNNYYLQDNNEKTIFNFKKTMLLLFNFYFFGCLSKNYFCKVPSRCNFQPENDEACNNWSTPSNVIFGQNKN